MQRSWLVRVCAGSAGRIPPLNFCGRSAAVRLRARAFLVGTRDVCSHLGRAVADRHSVVLGGSASCLSVLAFLSALPRRAASPLCVLLLAHSSEQQQTGAVYAVIATVSTSMCFKGACRNAHFARVFRKKKYWSLRGALGAPRPRARGPFVWGFVCWDLALLLVL